MAYIRSYKGQTWLLPPSIENMIPEDHICFLVEDLADSLDYSAFDIKYSGAGHPAYHSRIHLKLPTELFKNPKQWLPWNYQHAVVTPA